MTVYAAYQQRVVDEAAELNTKTVALSGFISSAKFTEVEEFEAARLVLQLQYMTQYLNILKERIASFVAPVEEMEETDESAL